MHLCVTEDAWGHRELSPPCCLLAPCITSDLALALSSLIGATFPWGKGRNRGRGWNSELPLRCVNRTQWQPRVRGLGRAGICCPAACSPQRLSPRDCASRASHRPTV